VNPQRFLNAAYPWVRWCFSPIAVLLTCALMVTALVLVLLHPAEVHQRLPDLQSWLQPRQLWLVAAVLAGAKLLHELGHAFACKHFGGECREMGLLLLVFTPCLYCDVSDAWMIPNRWRRAAVDAAGMYVEGALAAASTLVWWNSEPGWLNRICLMVMGVCGVSTLVFNGNPLLRYDGYFILSDVLNVPNLWQRSRAAVQSTAARRQPDHFPNATPAALTTAFGASSEATAVGRDAADCDAAGCDAAGCDAAGCDAAGCDAADGLDSAARAAAARDCCRSSKAFC